MERENLLYKIQESSTQESKLYFLQFFIFFEESLKKVLPFCRSEKRLYSYFSEIVNYNDFLIAKIIVNKIKHGEDLDFEEIIKSANFLNESLLNLEKFRKKRFEWIKKFLFFSILYGRISNIYKFLGIFIIFELFILPIFYKFKVGIFFINLLVNFSKSLWSFIYIVLIIFSLVFFSSILALFLIDKNKQKKLQK